MSAFSLHPQLEAETHRIGDLSLSVALLMDDARFPWIILVPRRENARELIDLSEADAGALSGEVRQASRAMRDLFKPHKLNVAALGNVTPQLHIHVVARFAEDAAWPRPVWGVGERAEYPPALRDERIAMLRAALGL